MKNSNNGDEAGETGDFQVNKTRQEAVDLSAEMELLRNLES